MSPTLHYAPQTIVHHPEHHQRLIDDQVTDHIISCNFTSHIKFTAANYAYSGNALISSKTYMIIRSLIGFDALMTCFVHETGID